jgi:hypothetical protein
MTFLAILVIIYTAMLLIIALKISQAMGLMESIDDRN